MADKNTENDECRSQSRAPEHDGDTSTFNATPEDSQRGLAQNTSGGPELQAQVQDPTPSLQSPPHSPHSSDFSHHSSEDEGADAGARAIDEMNPPYSTTLYTTLLRLQNDQKYGYGAGAPRFRFDAPYEGLALHLDPELQLPLMKALGLQASLTAFSTAVVDPDLMPKTVPADSEPRKYTVSSVSSTTHQQGELRFDANLSSEGKLIIDPCGTFVESATHIESPIVWPGLETVQTTKTSPADATLRQRVQNALQLSQPPDEVKNMGLIDFSHRIEGEFGSVRRECDRKIYMDVWTLFDQTWQDRFRAMRPETTSGKITVNTTHFSSKVFDGMTILDWERFLTGISRTYKAPVILERQVSGQTLVSTFNLDPKGFLALGLRVHGAITHFVSVLGACPVLTLEFLGYDGIMTLDHLVGVLLRVGQRRTTQGCNWSAAWQDTIIGASLFKMWTEKTFGVAKKVSKTVNPAELGAFLQSFIDCALNKAQVDFGSARAAGLAVGMGAAAVFLYVNDLYMHDKKRNKWISFAINVTVTLGLAAGSAATGGAAHLSVGAAIAVGLAFSVADQANEPVVESLVNWIWKVHDFRLNMHIFTTKFTQQLRDQASADEAIGTDIARAGFAMADGLRDSYEILVEMGASG
jgi:hypothetical protein